MDSDEIALLKEEIARLNRIITVLIEQHEIIKQNIGLVKNRKGKIGQESDISTSRSSNIQPDTDVSTHRGGKSGQVTELDTHRSSNFSHDIDFSAYRGGKIEPEFASATSREAYKSNPTVRFAKPGIGPVAYEDVPLHLPSTLNITGSVKAAVRIVSSRQVRQSYVDNACAVIIHLHNGGSGDYKTLRRLTGLSYDGMAKFMGSLKRKGLIQRTGMHRYVPGPKAKQGLADGWTNQLQFPD